MDRSTRQLLEHRVNVTRRQVTDLSTEMQTLSAKLSTALKEHAEAVRALQAAIKEETSTEDSITTVVNRFLNAQSQLLESPSESTIPVVNRLARRAGIRPGTIKAEVMDILKQHPDGLIALDILDHLNRQRPVPLERTSLSPQLSRLAKAGHIDRRGSLWFIAPLRSSHQ